MKRIKDTWKDVLNTQNGVRAVIEGTRYKRGENEVRKLLLDGSYHQIDPEKAKEFVEPLIESLRDFSWQHGEPRYKHQFCTNKSSKEGGKWRDLYVPQLEDHTIAHMVMNANLEVFTRGMHPFCCGSVPGRCIDFVRKKVRGWMRNDTQCRYFVKLDIRHFFDNIDREILKEKLRKELKDPHSLWAFDQIIDSAPVACPVGYYTSPWFANLYLQDLDWYISQQMYKMRRGKRINWIRHQLRYMDDMLLIGNCKSDLYKAVKKIKEYIKPLGLEIKNSWEVKKIGKMDNDGKLEKGTYWIDICGYKFCRNCVILRDKIFLETRRDVKKIKKLGYSEHRCKSLISKIGWAKKANSYHFLWDDIKPYVNIKSVRRYISNVDKERKRRIDEAFNKRAVG